MSKSNEAFEEENFEFSWGKKKGVGGKKREVQFYGSFTFDGEEYSLFDNVYLYKEDECEPYIGKLIKIWEQPEKKKKVKVLWFFRPVEIRNFLRDYNALPNEIFLASGEGVGLANINPLEAIAGKCNVVCTSKDSRNPQPPEEEVKMADYVFSHTFDVGKRTISDILDDKIAGYEVKDLLNKEGVQRSSDVSKPETVINKENGKEISNAKVLKISSEGKSDELVAKPLANVSLAEQDPSPVPSVKQERVSADETTLSRPVADTSKGVGRSDEVPISKAENKNRLKPVNNLDVSDDRTSKKARVDTSLKQSEKAGISLLSVINKDKSDDIVRKKLKVNSDDDHVKVSVPGSSVDDKFKSKLVKDPLRQDTASLKKAKSDEKTSKPSNGKVSKAAAESGGNLKTDVKALEVTKKPEADRSKWFKGIPWEDRMKRSYEQGTLVLLGNLDPTYSSGEVEDIIWHTFRENCTAKVLPRIGISSPHAGQALVIFKSRDAANMAVKRLEDGCLMLPNGRPLVASWGSLPPSTVGKSSSFVGHLVIDKVKHQMQRDDTKRAVSTSHCSQPNTVEYDMAMEWRLLQKKSDRWWKELYRRHGDELKKVKSSLKSK